jgi:hypothetical protein
MYLEECVKLSYGGDMVKSTNESLQEFNKYPYSAEREQLKKDTQDYLEKYISLGCGKDIIAEKCVYTDSQIKSLTSMIASIYQQPSYNSRGLVSPETLKVKLNEHKLFFDTNGCAKKIEEVASEETSKVISQFTNLDTARITADTTYQVQQRVFFGGLVLVAGLVIITMFNGNKK